MALEGSIRDFGLPDIIQFLRQQNKSGVLTIRTGTHWAKILFEQGKIVFAATEELQGAEGLAKRLVEAERLTEDQMEKLVKSNPGLVALENAIVTSGALSSDEMKAFIDLHSREVIFRLFRLEDGKYSFETDGTFEHPSRATPAEADFILLEGMRQFDEWPQLRKKISDPKTLFDKVADVRNNVKVSRDKDEGGEESTPSSEDRSIRVSEEEMTVFRYVDGFRDVEKLALLSNLGEFDTVKTLGGLLGKGAIYSKGVARTEPSAGESAAPRPPEESEAPARVSRRAGAHIGLNAVIGIVLCLWAVLLGPRIQDGFRSASEFRNIISKQMFAATKNGIRQAEEVYYLKNLKMPESAGDLLQEIEPVESFMMDVRKRGLRYPLDTGGSF
jgi:hypothetical protein